MGSESYIWVTQYRKNLADALERARNEVFFSGKFIGAELNPATFQEALAHDPEGGTGSLLDIVSVGGPDDFCSVYELTGAELLHFFGTEQPSLDEIRNCAAFWESFDRGQARAIPLYENGRPAKICFAGWTIDTGAAGDGSYEDASSRKHQAGFAQMMKEKAKKAPSAPPAEQISAGDRMSDLASVMKILTETTALSKQMSEHPSLEQMSDAVGKVRILEALLNKHDNDPSFFEGLAKHRPEIEKMAQEFMEREGFSDDPCNENQAGPRHEMPPVQNSAERGNTVQPAHNRKRELALVLLKEYRCKKMIMIFISWIILILAAAGMISLMLLYFSSISAVFTLSTGGILIIFIFAFHIIYNIPMHCPACGSVLEEKVKTCDQHEHFYSLLKKIARKEKDVHLIREFNVGILNHEKDE